MASCFDHFMTMNWQMKFSGAVIHRLLMRELHYEGPTNEMWYLLGNHSMRFSKVEFYLITGLPFGIIPDTTRYEAVQNGIHHRYFSGIDERVLGGVRCYKALPHLYAELDIDGVGREIQDSSLAVLAGGGPRCFRYVPLVPTCTSIQFVYSSRHLTGDVKRSRDASRFQMFAMMEMVPTADETETPYFAGLNERGAYELNPTRNREGFKQEGRVERGPLVVDCWLHDEVSEGEMDDGS
ncbi:hypothetical protein Ddye_011696 [Dipteronia dyeriana]|uniref:Uncharacterized protein n=1 Tax=Dipteronia dyeriana TaxID=168575 RepID=A0AAD9X2Z5_9ROSI|nr:hypothetical protein Ddye_011696 [Dipteronia dyeriana]